MGKGKRRHTTLLFKVDLLCLSVLHSFTSFNYSFIPKYVFNNYYIPDTVQIAEAEIVNQIGKTPVFMKKWKRKDNYNCTWGNR